jgi:FkbM family methyltransferase
MIDLAKIIPPNAFLGKILRFPLRIIPNDIVIRIFSGPSRGLRWISGSGIHGYWIGSYERDKQCAITKYIRGDMIAYDIGANVGFYTLLMSRFVGNEGKIYAFEPSPRNIHYITRHLALNKIKNVQVVECALGDNVGEALFETGKNASEGKIAPTGDISIKLYSLDYLLRNNTISAAGLVKIDVEGSEYAVLMGGREYFQTVKPIIFLATHGVEVSGQCIRVLRKWGYSVDTIGKNKNVDSADELIATPE